ncbi:glycosyltransferase [candidate division WWE3 bacterium]|nr:glycosyltransferase [candidate division WWE3 bacterium]
MPKVSIIFPALNERKRLERTIRIFIEHFNNAVELVIVDNGSSDGTAEYIRETYSSNPNIRLVYVDRPLGKGGAVYHGFDHVDAELVGFVDPDGSTSPQECEKLISEALRVDFVLASRWIPGASIDQKQPILRRVYGRSFNLLVNTLFNLGIKDTQCGAKFINRAKYLRIRPQLSIRGFAFDVELILRSKQAGYSIKEIPITWHDVEGSTVSQRSGFNAVKDVIKLWLRDLSR